jgi:hypothetical protein
MRYEQQKYYLRMLVQLPNECRHVWAQGCLYPIAREHHSTS